MSSNTLPDKAESGKLDLRQFILDSCRDNSRYTPEQKLQTVMSYIVHGNMKVVAKECNVGYEAIKWWRRADWWDVVLRELRRRHQDELDGRITGLIDSAMDGIADRIENGDARLTKDGDIRRVPMSGKELATTAGILFDKRAAMRGDPTTINRNISGEEQIQKLEDKFAQFANQMKDSGNLAKPIEEQNNGEKVLRGQTEAYDQEEIIYEDKDQETDPEPNS